MEHKTYNGSIVIHAPKDKVWKVLTQEPKRDIWMSAFSEGSHVEGNYMLGGRISFSDKTGNGLVGHVIVLEPEARVKLEYIGVIVDSKEDPTNSEVAEWQGCFDEYTLSEHDGLTTLSVLSVYPDRKDFSEFPNLYKKAFAKLKQLSEEENA